MVDAIVAGVGCILNFTTGLIIFPEPLRLITSLTYTFWKDGCEMLGLLHSSVQTDMPDFGRRECCIHQALEMMKTAITADMKTSREASQEAQGLSDPWSELPECPVKMELVRIAKSSDYTGAGRTEG